MFNYKQKIVIKKKWHISDIYILYMAIVRNFVTCEKTFTANKDKTRFDSACILAHSYFIYVVLCGRQNTVCYGIHAWSCHFMPIYVTNVLNFINNDLFQSITIVNAHTTTSLNKQNRLISGYTSKTKMRLNNSRLFCCINPHTETVVLCHFIPDLNNTDLSVVMSFIW